VAADSADRAAAASFRDALVIVAVAWAAVAVRPTWDARLVLPGVLILMVCCFYVRWLLTSSRSTRDIPVDQP